MRKYREYPVILMLAYLAFSFIANNFNITEWTKGDKIMCLIVIAVVCTSRIHMDKENK